MRWYWWVIIGWTLIAFILGPLVGAMLGRLSRLYPPPDDGS